jgi:hypothetical protein
LGETQLNRPFSIPLLALANSIAELPRLAVRVTGGLKKLSEIREELLFIAKPKP